MAEIQQVNGHQVLDYMARDYDSLLDSMRALIPSKLPEWTEYTSEADFGNVLLELFAHMGDILSYYQDRIANESFLGTAQTRRSIIQHLRLIGYHLGTAVPASALLEVTFPASFTDKVSIEKGNAFATKSLRDRKSVRFEYTQEQPLVIDARTLPPETMTENGNKKVVKRYRPGIPVEEGRLYKDQVIGTSDGSANQRFRLIHPGVIVRPLGPAQQVNPDIVLRTQLNGTIQPWALRETLAFSRAGQRDFILEIDESDRATVVFGDGAFGAIPAAGSIVQASYRVGGGTLGNVAARTIISIVDAPQLAHGSVTNPGPATGGNDRESIEHSVTQAPMVFRSLKRAVTSEDYQALALAVNGVSKVRAVASSWNAVTLYVAPTGGGQLSDVLEANLLAFFEDKRPVTTKIEIADVDFVNVYVTAQVTIKSYYVRETVRKQAALAAGALLALDNVDFGQTLYLSRFYDVLTSIDGIESVNITEFRTQGDPAGTVASNGRITLGVNQIPRAPAESEDPGYPDGVQVIADGGG